MYFIILLIVLVITTYCSISDYFSMHNYPLWYSCLGPFLVNAYLLLMFGVICLLSRKLIKKNYWYNNYLLYNVSKKEVKLYDALKIKMWKDYLPEMGKTSGFPKDKIRSLDIEYIYKFISETCFAEAVHILAIIFGFGTFLIFPYENYVCVLVITNMFLHIPLVIIQRYNRYRLNIIYKRKLSINTCNVAIR